MFVATISFIAVTNNGDTMRPFIHTHLKVQACTTATSAEKAKDVSILVKK